MRVADSVTCGRRYLGSCRQIDERKILVRQWQAHFGIVGGKCDPEPRSRCDELPEIGVLAEHHALVRQTDFGPLQVASSAHQLRIGGRERRSRRRVLGLGAIALLAKFLGAVELDPALLDERLRLADRHFIVGRIDPQQDLAGPEYTARDELRRNLDDRSPDLRAEQRLCARQYRTLAAYRELGRQCLQLQHVDQQRAVLHLALWRLLPKALTEPDGEAGGDDQDRGAQKQPLRFGFQESLLG